MRGNAADKLDWALGECRGRGLRRTVALEAVLRRLIAEERPLTLADLSEDPVVAGTCDRATVYRLLMRLEAKGMVRRLGLHDRAAHFIIKYPGEHHDFLICTRCGRIDKLDITCPVEALEAEISQRFGFRRLYHELEFFGICPACGT